GLAKAMGVLSDELGSVSADAAGVARVGDWFNALIDLYGAYAPVFVAFPAAMRERKPPARQALRDIGDRVGDALLGSVKPANRHPRIEGLSSVTVTMLL